MKLVSASSRFIESSPLCKPIVNTQAIQSNSLTTLHLDKIQGLTTDLLQKLFKSYIAKQLKELIIHSYLKVSVDIKQFHKDLLPMYSAQVLHTIIFTDLGKLHNLQNLTLALTIALDANGLTISGNSILKESFLSKLNDLEDLVYI